MNRKATITITPDLDSKMDIQTGGLTNLEILDAMKTIMPVFAKKIVDEAAEIGVTITNDEEFENYILFLRKNQM